MSKRTRLSGTAEQRIMQGSDRSGECWLWTGSLGREGYAAMKLNGRRCMAHRVAYEALVGPIPAGMQIDHLCRVRHCVNPAHLEPVTPQENNRRVIPFNSLKTHCPQGHPYDGANTYTWRGRRRNCRTCNAAAARRYQQRNVGGDQR